MRCEAKKKNGSPCRHQARPGRKRCVFHDPAMAERCAEGRRRGGMNRQATLPPATPDVSLRTMADVTAALGEAYNLVRTGRIAVNVGNCLAVLGQALLKAVEKNDLEQRVATLEKVRNGRSRV